jgi:L-Ala-D/L-Glu epimerase / N-acetyl-D-glutamate racemase
MFKLPVVPLNMDLVAEQWPLAEPFRITGRVFDVMEILKVVLKHDGLEGKGEAVGVYYREETVASMCAQIEPVRVCIERGMPHADLRSLLPPGGARNALDCAWWDLEAKRSGVPVWQAVGLSPPQPLLTTFGCGADTPENMARAAANHRNALAIKLKLTGEPIDAARVQAVRAARADVWLAVDANQGFTRKFLESLMPTLLAERVSLIEQPFPVGKEAWLRGFESPIPMAADESLQSLEDLPALAEYFDTVNIKLDKCGGLSEALAISRKAARLGLRLMVGNMIGTSLAMAPAYLVGQLCEVVDLDGPLFLKADRTPAVRYVDGYLQCPQEVWGGVT